MKTIPAIELQTNLDAVLNSSQKERIVVSRAGKPCAVLVGIQDYDAEDMQAGSFAGLLAHDPAAAVGRPRRSARRG